MPKFELEFKTHFENPDGENKEGQCSRVIEAENKKTGNHQELACRIGKAMIGEEISSHECLKEATLVNPTNKPYSNYWDDSETWKDVAIYFKLGGEDVGFIYKAGNIVGLRLYE